jgi:hypothetical protein
MTSAGGLEELAARVAHFERLLAKKQQEECKEKQTQGLEGVI